MPTVTNPNWYDINADRDYPFLDGVSRTASGGGYTIPNDLIVDLRLSASSGLDSSRFFVSRLRAFGTGLIIDFSVDGVGLVATAAIPDISTEEFQSFRVVGVGGNAVSQAPWSSVAPRRSWLQTSSTTPSPWPRLASCPRSSPRPGRGQRSDHQDRNGVETRLTGEVTLAEGENATISVGGQIITVGMASGVVTDPCGCDDPGGLNRPAIRTINGVGPDGSGDLSVVTEGCPDLDPLTNGLKLTDRCAEPCCGEDELNALTNGIQDLDRLLADYAARASRRGLGPRRRGVAGPMSAPFLENNLALEYPFADGTVADVTAAVSDAMVAGNQGGPTPSRCSSQLRLPRRRPHALAQSGSAAQTASSSIPQPRCPSTSATASGPWMSPTPQLVQVLVSWSRWPPRRLAGGTVPVDFSAAVGHQIVDGLVSIEGLDGDVTLKPARLLHRHRARRGRRRHRLPGPRGPGRLQQDAL